MPIGRSLEAALLSLGKGPADVWTAAGMVVPAAGLRPDDLPLTLDAVGIDGVPADVWGESYTDAALAALGAESASAYLSGWCVIGGREVYVVVLTPEAIAELRDAGASVPDARGLWAYPVGEVLYWILMPFEWPAAAPTAEDVLAELP